LLFREYSQRYFPAAGDLIRYLCDYAEIHSSLSAYDTTVARIARDGTRSRSARRPATVYAARTVVVPRVACSPTSRRSRGIELAET